MADAVQIMPGAERARRSQKAATRQRVLAAARELFDTHGYEGTTIREIARHAGVAVGSVFTTFSSKGEILSEVMQERLNGLYAELDRVIPQVRGSTTDRLRTLFGIFFQFEAQHTRLFLAHIAAAYDWTLPPTAKPFGRAYGLQQVIRDCILQGVKAGDVRKDCHPDEIIQLLTAAYAWSYQLVVTQGADAETMIQVMDRQIGLIAEGFAPR
jgi:TetR/AcrR family transcriptional regulator, cholesterol catabolism regulator